MKTYTFIYLVSISLLGFSCQNRNNHDCEKEKLIPNLYYVEPINFNNDLKIALKNNLDGKSFCLTNQQIVMINGSINNNDSIHQFTLDPLMQEKSNFKILIEFKWQAFYKSQHIVVHKMFVKENNNWKNYLIGGQFKLPSDYQISSGITELNDDELIKEIIDICVGLTFK